MTHRMHRHQQCNYKRDERLDLKNHLEFQFYRLRTHHLKKLVNMACLSIISQPFWLLLVVAVGTVACIPVLQKSRPISVQIQSGKFKKSYDAILDFRQCIKIDSKLSSTLQLNTGTIIGMEPKYKYFLLGFSSETCDDDHVVMKHALKGESRVVLNERKPICSFRVNKGTQTVKFVYENNVETCFTVSHGKNGSCYNLCRSNDHAHSSGYPQTVNILRGARILRNKAIQLFSERDCEDDSGILHADSNSRNVYSGTNLNQLTLKDGVSKVRSFLIGYET